LIRLFTWFK